MEQKSGKKRKADHYGQRNMTCVKMSVSKHRNDVSRIAIFFFFFLSRGGLQNELGLYFLVFKSWLGQ